MNLMSCLPFLFAMTTLSLEIVDELSAALMRTHKLWQRYEDLHYCGRLEALKLNLQAVNDYLTSLNLDETYLLQADRLMQTRYGYWFKGQVREDGMCIDLKDHISVYMQKNKHLPPSYPNWTYAVHIDSEKAPFEDYPL